MTRLTYGLLRDAVDGAFVALRARTELMPAGGDGAKVFPPTYGVEERAATKYATETRRVGGEDVPVVLLDSVASQANRLELALLDGWEAGELAFPNPAVSFDGTSIADLGSISALEAPHRVADAIFRDSLLDGTLFRLSERGRAITDARPNAATPLFTFSPTALLFGMWDSTGPKGGLGSKFQRCIESEIVGIGARTGAKVGSRIDPLQVAAGIAVYQHPDPAEAWTTDENEAVKDKSGKPVRFDRKGAGGDPGRPSKINHGNVTPSIESRSGGVTIDEAIQLTVLSFPALRKLRFPSLGDGSAVPAEARRRVDGAARTALAALGVAAIAYLHEQDHDLRSRCLLVPTAPPALELLPRDGSSPVKVEIDRQSAVSLLAEAATSAAEAGLPWPAGQVVLTPAPKLVDLVQRSRHLSADDLGED